MLESRWPWVRALGSVCVLGCMLSVACSDPELNGGNAGTSGGGTGGSGSGGTSSGGTSSGGTSSGGGTGGTSSEESECRCGGRLDCPATLDELCAELPEGCPARIDTWLTCAERGQLAPRDDVGAPYLKDCDGHRIVHRQANYIGQRSWIYDQQGTLVGVTNIDDSGVGPRCGLILANECRFGSQGDPLLRASWVDAGSDAGANGDADADVDAGASSDGGVEASSDGGVDAGSSSLDCSRL